MCPRLEKGYCLSLATGVIVRRDWALREHVSMDARQAGDLGPWLMEGTDSKHGKQNLDGVRRHGEARRGRSRLLRGVRPTPF